MTILHREFDILRMEIQPADNDHVFQPSGDIELALPYKAEISGPEVWTVPFAIRVKRFPRRLRPIPIAERDRVSRNPNLSDLLRRRTPARFRVDNGDLRPAFGPSVANQKLCRRICRGGRCDQLSRECLRISSQYVAPGTAPPARNLQRTLGQAISRQKHALVEPSSPKRLYEPPACLFSHRFRSIEGYHPTAEIKRRPLL